MSHSQGRRVGSPLNTTWNVCCVSFIWGARAQLLFTAPYGDLNQCAGRKWGSEFLPLSLRCLSRPLCLWLWCSWCHCTEVQYRDSKTIFLDSFFQIEATNPFPYAVVLRPSGGQHGVHTFTKKACPWWYKCWTLAGALFPTPRFPTVKQWPRVPTHLAIRHCWVSQWKEKCHKPLAIVLTDSLSPTYCACLEKPTTGA